MTVLLISPVVYASAVNTIWKKRFDRPMIFRMSFEFFSESKLGLFIDDLITGIYLLFMLGSMGGLLYVIYYVIMKMTGSVLFLLGAVVISFVFAGMRYLLSGKRRS